MSSIKRKPQAVAAVEQALLRCVRSRGVISRGELSQELDLVQSTIGVYVDRLVREGYLKETCPAERGLGRPPLLVELNAKKGRFIGIDFHARQLKAVAVDFAQQPLNRVEHELSEPVTAAGVIDVLLQSVDELIGEHPDDVLGIGVGTPGLVDSDRGIGLSYSFIPDWRDIPVADLIRNRWNIPVWLEHNIRSWALAEYWFGQGRGLQHFVCLCVRSGIAAGMMVGGQLFRGTANLAGEIGQWRVPLTATNGSAVGTDEPVPVSVEDLSSLTALIRSAVERISRGESSVLSRHGSALGVAALLDGVRAQDPLAIDLVERAAEIHAWMIHQLDCVLNPQRIMVAGPLTEASYYWERLQDTCRNYRVPHFVTRVCRSELGTFGGALGAAALAVSQWKPQR